jgi:phosphoribosylanthranilate isomerase
MKTRVKICGITNRKDAFLAADLGAFAAGSSSIAEANAA